MANTPEKRARNKAYSKTEAGKASQARAYQKYKDKKNEGTPIEGWIASPTLLVSAMNNWR